MIHKTLNDPVEMRYFDHNILVQAQATKGLDNPGYQEARKRLLETYGTNGIDRVMRELELDALVSPTNSPAGKTDKLLGEKFLMNSAAPAARAGYPHITVPMGQIEGLPVNISFFGRAFSEPTLIEIAYSFEQGTRHRFTPKFMNPGLE